jgi:uncharacterized protein YbaR (Trm112 family)
VTDASQLPAISPELLEILVCPVDKEELRLEDQRLVCTVCGRVYPIEDGIPNMLVEDDA